jgi:hypothetical protein
VCPGPNGACSGNFENSIAANNTSCPKASDYVEWQQDHGTLGWSPSDEQQDGTIGWVS